MTVKTVEGAEVFLKVEEIRAISGKPGENFYITMDSLTIVISEVTVHAVKAAIMNSGQKQYIGNLP